MANLDPRYKFHLIKEEGITYLCLAESSLSTSTHASLLADSASDTSTAFAFLSHIREDFGPYLGKVAHTPAGIAII